MSPFAAVPRVDRLDLESLAPGRVHRLLLELVQDGLGRPVHVPVMVLRGRREGPTFGLTAALHGNELNGIPLIHDLFGMIEARQLRGTLVAVVVANVPSYLAHQRNFTDGRDLNHMMPGKATGTVSQVYAYQLVERVLTHLDYLIDLHTASTGRVNSLYIRADLMHPQTAQMAYLQRPQIIVHNPASDHTLRGTAMERGIPAITLEIGDPSVFQPRTIQRALVGIRAVLAEARMLRRRPMSLGPLPVLCERSYWLYTDHGGILRVAPRITQEVHAGDVVAELVDVFGEPLREYKVAESGVVIGHSINPVGSTGARILHLGIPVRPDDERFVRRQPASGKRSLSAPEA